MNPLPVIVISGYLGAGKTTLINQLLRAAGGQRIMVLVNDFGAINIDADLLQSADEDTLTLTNGCVCCTMGADLFMALGDVLDRRPRPDILIVEASGIAEPRRIAQAAKAEPDLRYGGIVTVVDGLNFLICEADNLIGPQVREQIIAADMLLIAKTPKPDAQLLARLAALNKTPPLQIENAAIQDLLLTDPQTLIDKPATHAHYAHWSYSGERKLTLDALKTKLAAPPAGAFRIKGKVMTSDSGPFEVHLVGNATDIRPASDVTETTLVAIGLSQNFTPETAQVWWNAGN